MSAPKSQAGTMAAPFPWFGGKSLACETVWQAFGQVDNYVEPFCGSAAMLLGAPDGKRVETINDADGFVANFWRAVAADPHAVAAACDWPCNEVDLLARHVWLVNQRSNLLDQLHADPRWFDAEIAGWWCWGSCNWIGSGWCGGDGPWVHDGERVVDSRKLPHLGDAGRGVNRQLPHLGDAGQGVNRKLPHLSAGQGLNERSKFIHGWFEELSQRLREVRVACGDWARVLSDSVTVRHGLTAVFLDPPYTLGKMDYTAGGVGGGLAHNVQAWCAQNGARKDLRIVLCGHAGEHDALLALGWASRKWVARKGYAVTEEAIQNSAGETVWCSPHCVAEEKTIDLFSSLES